MGVRKKRYILSLDQGTTGSRAILYDSRGSIAGSAYREFTQYYPKPGWVEHDAEEIWRTVLWTIHKALQTAGISPPLIAAIGITNQRETSVLWSRRTGKPIARAIVWQDRRTADKCRELKTKGYGEVIRKKTGLPIDPYFSATKIHWLLQHHPSFRSQARRGEVLFGTMDSWLLWNLTGGKVHATDFTNAARTLLFDIHRRAWDPSLLHLLKIPSAILPQTYPSAYEFGQTARFGKLPSGIPILSMLGDQQAALYGQSCYHKGQGKNTYGTGCFVVVNSGTTQLKTMPKGLLTTLACDERGRPVYAMEGAIFIAGAAIQWLRDGMQFFRHASETDAIIKGLKSSEGVTVIPAFVGLGSPHWNSEIRGSITGITRGTTVPHIIRATLESIAHQSADVVEAMRDQAGCRLTELRVDGGATHNRFLMQFQADLLQIPVWVSDSSELTAWGAAKLAGKQGSIWRWNDEDDHKRIYRVIKPRMKAADAKQLRKIWKLEVERMLEGVSG